MRTRSFSDACLSTLVKMRVLTGVVMCTALVVGCASNNANYPPLTGAFGKATRTEGLVQIVREESTLVLSVRSSLFVGDQIEVVDGGDVEIELAPGQVVHLSGGTVWRIDQVVSNGAAFGSQTSLKSGELTFSGKEYMPHTLNIATPRAEVKTYSENFRLSLRTSDGSLLVESFSGVPVTVSNEHGSMTLDAAGEAMIVPVDTAPLSH